MSEIINCWPKVLLFGDSITQKSFDEQGGWATLLASSLQRQADLVNRGFSGYNSRWCLRYLEPLFGRVDFKEVAALTICLGANDSWNDQQRCKGNQHVLPTEFERNLIATVNWFRDRGLSQDRIVLCTPPTFMLDDWLAFKAGEDCQTKSMDALSEYVRIVRKVSSHLKTRLADVHEVFRSYASNSSELFVDGLHLSKLGARLFFDCVQPVIHELVYAHRKTDNLNCPVWSEISDQ